MFNSFKKKERKIISPMSGFVVPLEKVPDEAFSDKILGIGAAVAPTSGDVFSPVDGVITDITDTKHAFCISAEDGTELLLHIGINTVSLKGEGFTILVDSGAKVSAGQKIAEVDLELLKKYELCIETPVVLTEQEKYKIVEIYEGETAGGTDVLFTYRNV